MATLPHTSIDPVPQESLAPGAPYPALDPITVVDRVGPGAANRQPNALEDRDNTLRERLNSVVENINYVSQGGPGSGSLYLPRDGSETMTDDLTLTKSASATINVTSTAGASWVKLRAASGSATGVEGHVNGVQQGYVQISNNGAGAGGRIDLYTLDGTNPVVHITAGTSYFDFKKAQAYWSISGAIYTFNTTSMVVPGAINVPASSKVNLDGGTGNNYVYADGLGRVYIRAVDFVKIFNGSGLAVTVAATETLFEGNNVRLNGTLQLQLGSSSDVVWASTGTGMFVESTNNVRVRIAASEKMIFSSTATTSWQNLRVSSTNQLQFGGSGGYACSVFADGVDGLFLNATASMYFQMSSATKFLIAPTTITSYNPINMNSTSAVTFNGTSNYITGVSTTSLVAHAGSVLTLAVSSQDKLRVEATYTYSYNIFRMAGTYAIQFGGSGGYAGYLYANGTDDVVIGTTATVGVYTQVAGANHFSVTSTYIDAFSKRIVNLSSPIGVWDAANKLYVDNAIAGVTAIGWQLKTGGVGTESSLLAITVGDNGCDFTTIDGAIDFVNGATYVGYAIYVFSRNGGHALGASKTIPTYTSIIGMSGEGNKVPISLAGSVSWTLSNYCVIKNLWFTESSARTVGSIVVTSAATGVVIENCAFTRTVGLSTYYTITASGAGGGFVGPAKPSVRVSDCYIECDGGRGIDAGGNDVVLENIVILGSDYAIYSGSGHYHHWSNINVKLVAVGSGVYGIYVNSTNNSSFENIHIESQNSSYTSLQMIRNGGSSNEWNNIHVYCPSGSSGIYGFYDSLGYTTLTNGHFWYCRVILDAYSSMMNCVVIYDDPTTTNYAVNPASLQGRVTGCYINRVGVNSPGIQVGAGGIECIIHGNIVDNTGTAPSIRGTAGASLCSIMDNMIDVATSANGAASWYIADGNLI